MTLKFLIPSERVIPGAAQSSADEVFRLGYELWMGLGELPVTAEAVGWLSLLSKSLHVAQQAMLNEEGSSAIGSAAAERLLLELHSQVHAVCRPLAAAGAGNLQAEQPRNETRKALRMYAAWCVQSELDSLDELSDKRTLDDVLEPHTARTLIKNLGAARGEYERLLGPIPEDSDQELSFDRKRIEESLRADKERLLSLVAILGLEPMLSRLKTKLQDARQKGDLRGGASFSAAYAVMNDEPVPSVRMQLKQAAIGFAYSWYSADSLRLHGSSLALEFDDTLVAPRLTAPTAASKDDLAQLLRDVLVRLAFLRAYLPHDV